MSNILGLFFDKGEHKIVRAAGESFTDFDVNICSSGERLTPLIDVARGTAGLIMLQKQIEESESDWLWFQGEKH